METLEQKVIRLEKKIDDIEKILINQNYRANNIAEVLTSSNNLYDIQGKKPKFI